MEYMLKLRRDARDRVYRVAQLLKERGLDVYEPMELGLMKVRGALSPQAVQEIRNLPEVEMFVPRPSGDNVSAAVG